MEIEQTIVELAKEFNSLGRIYGREANEIVVKLQLIGQTAAFFGGFDGMTRLHDAAEALVGRDNSVGYTLNQAWHGIGGWWA